MKNSTLLPYEKASATLSPIEKLGQSFMAAAFINDPEVEQAQLQNLVEKGWVGGLCFFHSRASAATNFEGAKEEIPENEQSLDRLKELILRFQETAPHPLLISIDAEWGLAMRVENTPKYPYAITLGAMQHAEDLVREVGKSIGQDCRHAGIHWNFAPVVDVNANPENPVIGYRSFGEGPQQVSKLALAFLKGLEATGCLGCIKHFPGHGDTSTDSHLALPAINVSKDTLNQRELVPFRKLIAEGAQAVMVGHLSVPALDDSGTPATFSKKIIQQVLRNDMGFDGLVVSDALNMKALPECSAGEIETQAYLAGNDMLCFPLDIEAGLTMLLEQADTTRIEESFRRIWKIKEKVYTGLATPPASIPPGLHQRLAQASLTQLRGDTNTLSDFRDAPFSLVEFGRDKTPFTTAVQQECRVRAGEISKLIAIFPPSVKPRDNFGFSPEVMAAIKELMASGDVVVYLFGNPYFLDLLPWWLTKVVVIAYEDGEPFQRNAADHFLGKVKASGKLPVTLKTDGHG